MDDEELVMGREQPKEAVEPTKRVAAIMMSGNRCTHTAYIPVGGIKLGARRRV